MAKSTRSISRRGIYLLPNLFTTGALFAGFYSITSAMNGRFETAVIAIFAALILDGMDGRVARMTNTQSEFGAQYDSLADMISFAAAPALVMYIWALSALGKPGLFAAFVHAAGGALRLARFNTQIGNADKRYFQGLPSPAAAAFLAAFIWLCMEYDYSVDSIRILVLVLTVTTGLLMVSNFRYYSFKEIDLKGRVPFVMTIGIMLGFALILTEPQSTLFCLFLAYAVSGPLLTIIQLRQTRLKRKNEGDG